MSSTIEIVYPYGEVYSGNIQSLQQNMKILLIEDDNVIAGFVSKGMAEAGYTVQHLDDGRLGLHAALYEEYDLAIIDIMLPRLDGLSIIQQMRNKGMMTPILVLSAKRGVDDRIAGLQLGSDDYLVKPFSFGELLARVDALLRRANNSAETTHLDVDNLSMDLLGRTVKRAGKRIDLQPKEFSLLEYLLRNQGRVVSKTMIIERVWNYSFDPGTNVVEARVSKLREKIDRDFDTPLIHTVRGLGYVLKVEAQGACE